MHYEYVVAVFVALESAGRACVAGLAGWAVHTLNLGHDQACQNQLQWLDPFRKHAT
jgi:hypothetical protein